MFDRDPDRYIIVFGLYFEDAFWCGEQNIRDDGFGGDGQLVQPSAAESGTGAPPGYEVAGLTRAGQVEGYFSAVDRGIHPRRVQCTAVSGVLRIDSVANPTRSGRLQEVLARRTRDPERTTPCSPYCSVRPCSRDARRSTQQPRRTTRPKPRPRLRYNQPPACRRTNRSRRSPRGWDPASCRST